MEYYPQTDAYKWIVIYAFVGVILYGMIQYHILNEVKSYNYQTHDTAEQISDWKTYKSDWKTYKNDEYGFEVKYPYSYEVVGPVSGPVNGQVGFTFQDKSEKLNLDNTFVININPTPLSFTPEKIAAGPIATLVDGVSGQRYKIKWKWDDNKEYISDYVEVKKGKSSYIFSDFGLRLDAFPFEKILSTFKFTDSQTKAKDGVLVGGTSVSVVRNGQVVQTIPFSEEALWVKNNSNVELAVSDKDINFDGYHDLSVISSSGYMGVNFFYDYYLFNPTTKLFEKTGLNICNPQFKKEEKKIYSSCKSGPTYLTTVYTFNGKEYIAGETIDEFTKLPVTN
ncbi:MAG: hypothetical protein Q7S10_03755 [bacterium]|nr:hypothetical protein [bacterium]